jgi:hypothetical protein
MPDQSKLENVGKTLTAPSTIAYCIEHVRVARPVHMGVLVVVCVLALAAIGGGCYAIYRGAAADSEFDLLGAHIKTTHVGVAFVALGIVMVLFTLRRLMQSVERLAALPPAEVALHRVHATDAAEHLRALIKESDDIAQVVGRRS